MTDLAASGHRGSDWWALLCFTAEARLGGKYRLLQKKDENIERSYKLCDDDDDDDDDDDSSSGWKRKEVRFAKQYNNGIEKVSLCLSFF